MKANQVAPSPPPAPAKPANSAVVPCPKPGAQKKKEPKEAKLLIVLYFDGTNNNMANVELREKAESGAQLSISQARAWKKHGDDGSYQEGLTNVVHLYRQTKDEAEGCKQVPIYIDGIGTESGLSDSPIIGQGLGWGNQGVNAKVEKGFREVVDALISALCDCDDGETLKLSFALFGFSRGAAAARSFVRRLLDSKAELEKIVKVQVPKAKCEWDGPIKFVGLFDTVSSVTTLDTLVYGDVKSLSLDAIKSAQKVVQLAAADEYRKHFPLTDIASAGAKGTQIFLPGAHADIGGGYRDIIQECFTAIESSSDEKRRAEIDWLLGMGWIRDRSQTGSRGNQLEVTRAVSNVYARIPLLKMHDFAKNVVAYVAKIKSDFSVDHEPALVRLKAEIDAKSATSAATWINSPPSAALKEVRAKFLHFSSDSSDFVNKPRMNGNKREREIIRG